MSFTPIESFAAGCAALTAEFDLPRAFSEAVLSEATGVANRSVAPTGSRVDLRHLPFVTLDPSTSIDLDQAFVLSQEVGSDSLTLHYAIADVGLFVDAGSALEAEAFRRGETTYLPTHRIPQYPSTLCEDAVSLLPDVDRAAIVMEVLLSADGQPTLRAAYRATVRSTAKLAYERIDPAQIPLLEEFAARVTKGEDARGASRSILPEQSVDLDDHGHPALVSKHLLPSEAANSALSLSANLAVGNCFVNAGIGIFRVMDRPTKPEIDSLRRDAQTLHVEWPSKETLGSFQRRLDPTNPTHRSLLISARRFGGGASYATIGCGVETDITQPYHAAIAGVYSHVTAPLRRLADRYALDLLIALFDDDQVAIDGLKPELAALPEIMRASAQRSGKVERAVVDLAECVVLADQVGQTFPATVLESTESGAVIQLDQLAVRSRLPRSARVVAGSSIEVRLDDVDIESRRLKFSVASR
jgi:exoribonuclease R